jgi:hypothetical protein
MRIILMLGAVTGYSKHHTMLGSPELRQRKIKYRKKVIKPRKKESIKYIHVNKPT